MEKHIFHTIIWTIFATSISFGWNPQPQVYNELPKSCNRSVPNNPCSQAGKSYTPNFRDSDPILNLIRRGESGECPTPDQSFGCKEERWNPLEIRFLDSLYTDQHYQPDDPITVGQMIKYFGEPDQVLVLDRSFMAGIPIFDIDFFYSTMSLRFHSGQHDGTEYTINPDTYVLSWSYSSREEYQSFLDYWTTQHDPFPSKITNWNGYGVYSPFNKTGKSLLDR